MPARLGERLWASGPGVLWGLHPHSPAGWGAVVCGPAESGPDPGKGATVAPAGSADGAENAAPPATRHYSWLARIPKQGVAHRAAPGPACL